MSASPATAAAQMEYWATCGPGKPQGGDYSVGYSQPDRWMAYERSTDLGWLTADANMDCSAGVAAAWNFAFHADGEPWDSSVMFPRDTYTGNIRAYAVSRGFEDVHWDDNSLYPDGGLQLGDLILSEAASGGAGHVAMVTRSGLSEAWIAEDGSIDGYIGDQTGSECRCASYEGHLYTQTARWTHCLRYLGGTAAPVPAAQEQSRASHDGYELSYVQQAVLRAADNVGCPWWAALAALWMETGEYGANIFGHDAGGAYCGGGEVTEAKFRDFYAQISAGATSNGVGPLQVTYPGYFFNDPDRAWWDPEKSAEVGCGIIRDLIDAEGDSYEDLKRAGSRYNSGSAYGAYEAYGVPFSDRCRSWYNYGRPDGAGQEAWEMAEGVDLLREIRDLFRSGQAGDHFAGDMNWYAKATYEETKAIHAAVDKVLDALTPGQEGVKPAGAIYGAVNDIRTAVKPADVERPDAAK